MTIWLRGNIQIHPLWRQLISLLISIGDLRLMHMHHADSLSSPGGPVT